MWHQWWKFWGKGQKISYRKIFFWFDSHWHSNGRQKVINLFSMSKIIWIYLSHFKILVRSSFHGMHIYVHILETICFLKDAQFLTTHSKVSENQKPLRYLKLTFEQRSILPVDSCPQNSTTGVTLVCAHFWYLSGLDKLVSTM